MFLVSNFGIEKLGNPEAGLSKFGKEIPGGADGKANPPRAIGGIAEGVLCGPSIFNSYFLLKSVMNENEAYFCLSPDIVSLNLEY